MTKKRIELIREILLPFVKENLAKINYEGQGKHDAEEFEKDFNEILNLAIKSLEKEPVLDKIRSEIEELDGRYVIGDYGIYGENIPKYVRFCDVLQIIDKYRAESEGKR